MAKPLRYPDERPSWGGNRGTRHERGYDSQWDKLRLLVLERDMNLCQACLRVGRTTPLRVKKYDHEVDHIVPKKRGGSNEMDNLQSLCVPCHKSKSEAEAVEGAGGRPRPKYDSDGFPVWD